MTNQQAAWLRPGERIRRKEAWDTIYVVERVEPKADRKSSVTIHAGGQVFKPWEIERVRADL
jgi:hypothetical protein